MPQKTLFCNRFLKCNSGYPPRKDLDGGGPINLIILIKNNLSHILTTMRLHKAGDINRMSSRETPLRHGREKKKNKAEGRKRKKVKPWWAGPKKGTGDPPNKTSKNLQKSKLEQTKVPMNQDHDRKTTEPETSVVTMDPTRRKTQQRHSPKPVPHSDILSQG